MTAPESTDLRARLASLDPAQRAALAARLAARREGKTSLGRRPGPRDTFPLGMDQERLWVLDQLYPGTTTYTLGFGLRFLGELDQEAFTRAANAVVARHELLHSSVEVLRGRPVLRLHPGRGADLTFTDRSDGPDEEREERRKRFIKEQVARPFDLGRDPVLRIAVADLGGDHQVVQTMPHSFTDQWSYVRINKELLEFYRAFKEGDEPDVPELPVQFGDWAQWQRDLFDGPQGERHRAFWRDYLAGVPERLALPYDHPQDTTDHDGRQYNFVLDPEVAAAFAARARQSRSTVANAMAAVYATLLYEETGERDVIVGVPSVTRSEPAVQDIAGFLLTNLPLRVRIPEHPTPAGVLAAAQAAGSAIAGHHEVPFGEIVKAAAPERSHLGYPLLQTMLVHLDLADSVFYTVPGARVYANAVNEGISSMDMTIAWWQVSDVMFGRIEYRTALFEESTVARLSRRLLQLVELFAHQPDAPLAPRGAVGVRQRAADLWREALGVDRADPQDAFADRGGTPLAAARLTRALREAGAAPTVGIRPATTLGELAEHLATATGRRPGAAADDHVPGRLNVSADYLERLFSQGSGVGQENL
ncbi:condensation domain-containing protein [Streptomyces sp. NPDC001941]|uniref:condensation domain-containing protein n=1 Tax=Streptomyces sp. NPDC001941 TaxID=3154659 RepID=UPI003319509F